MATGGSDKPAELVKIGSNLVQNVKTKESITVESLWANNDVVIMFLRRFG